jgi:hypothetical protein
MPSPSIRDLKQQLLERFNARVTSRREDGLFKGEAIHYFFLNGEPIGVMSYKKGYVNTIGKGGRRSTIRDKMAITSSLSLNVCGLKTNQKWESKVGIFNAYLEIINLLEA